MNETITGNWSQLREASGLSLEEIAEQTNISIRKLEALERHDFEVLGAQTYAMGYIRRYAKLIRHDPEVLITFYRQNTQRKAEHEQPLPEKPNLTSGSATSKLTVLNISAVVVVIWVIYILVASGEDTEVSVSDTSEQAEAQVLDNDAGIDDAESLDLSNAGDPENTAIEAPQESLEEASIEQVDSLGANSATAPVYSQVPEVSPSPLPVLSQAATSTDAPTVTDSVSSEDQLVFTLNDECWVWVKDATGRVLIAEVKRKGDNLQIFGQGPFEVKLGNARGVELSVNGRFVETEPRPGNRTLRLTVQP